MSLINDMLQDLDSRKQLQNPDSVSNVEIAAPLLDSARPRTVWIFSGLVLAAAIGFWLAQPLVTGFWLSKPTLPEEPVHAVTDKDDAGVKTAVELLPVPVTNSEKVKENVDNTPVEMIPENIAAVETDKHRPQIERLLSTAEVALSNNRLSLPRGLSAYDLYHRVIAIDASNAPAQAGLEKIKTRYVELIDDALAATEFERAAQLVNRVGSLSLTFSSSQLGGYRDRIQEQQLAAQSSTTELNEPASVAADNQESVDTYLAINKTALSRELALARDAQQLFARGRGREAAAQLETFIANNARADLSRILLFDYYLDQTLISQAREVMEPGQVVDAATLAYMQARLSMMSSGTAPAIALLEKQKPGKNIVEIYNTLLAGLYQKEKSHGKAVVLYASLIEINPSNATYWLGMGVSQDALGEYQRALNAYNVVLAHKNLDANVRNFVETRIQALASQELAEAAW